MNWRTLLKLVLKASRSSASSSSGGSVFSQGSRSASSKVLKFGSR